MNEQLVVTPITLKSSILARGEFVLIVEPGADVGVKEGRAPAQVLNIIGRLTNHVKFNDDEIVRIVAAVEGVSERAATRLIKKHKILVKRQIDALA